MPGHRISGPWRGQEKGTLMSTKDSTIHNPTIEYRLDSYGDDLNEVLEDFDMPEFRVHIKSMICAGLDLGLLEHITKTISATDKSKEPVLPTRFREYRARLVFVDSVSEDGQGCQNYLVRSSELARELLRFPHNPNLQAAMSAKTDVVTIKARIWSAQPGHVWNRDLGLLLGMSGDEFHEKMMAATEQFEQMRGV